MLPSRDIPILPDDPIDGLLDLDRDPIPGDERLATMLECRVYDAMIEAADAGDRAEFERLKRRAAMARTLRASICEKLECAGLFDSSGRRSGNS